MFWDKVAGVYDVFANVINRKVHRELKVVAANVIHLLDKPEKALSELARVCKPDGTLIIPTYMNKDAKGKTSAFARTVGKAGADFKRQFTESSYKDFFAENGFEDVSVVPIRRRIPCAVAVIRLNRKDGA